MNGMAYWQAREANERERRRRPRSAAHDRASIGDELGAIGASGSGNGNGGGDAERLQNGGNGQWEDERGEVTSTSMLFARDGCVPQNVGTCGSKQFLWFLHKRCLSVSFVLWSMISFMEALGTKG